MNDNIQMEVVFRGSICCPKWSTEVDKLQRKGLLSATFSTYLGDMVNSLVKGPECEMLSTVCVIACGW
jgi:hypothetical protein